jgi:hypothetical protein
MPGKNIVDHSVDTGGYILFDLQPCGRVHGQAAREWSMAGMLLER